MEASRAAAALVLGESVEACRHVEEVTRRRSVWRSDHWWAMRSRASQSSNSGWEGGLPLWPKSLGVVTRPALKQSCQSRLTMTRAVRGLSGAVIHAARAERRWEAGSWVAGCGKTTGMPWVTVASG